MKLKTTVNALLNAFELTSPTLDNKGVSSNLYLQANDKSGFLYLYSTNLLTETFAKLKAEITLPGEVLINPSKLKDGLVGIGKESSVNLELTPTGNQLKVQCGKVKFSLSASADVKEMGNRLRTIPFKSVAAVTIPASELLEFTKRSGFCLPDDKSGQLANLAVLKMSDTEAGEETFATNGSIMVHVASVKKQSTGNLGSELQIPSQALPPLAGLVAKKTLQTIDIIISGSNRVFFKFADGTYFGTLTQATNYPNLKTIVSQVPKYKFEIVREELKSTLMRAKSFVNQETTIKSLELEFNQESLIISANGQDPFTDEIGISYIGDKPESKVRIGVDINYLINIIAGSNSEKLTLGFTSDTSPVMVQDTKGEDDDLLNIKYIVMGIKLGPSK
jgi:DNA polymerase III sliding clamp (beta) subunit (PCNA family)